MVTAYVTLTHLSIRHNCVAYPESETEWALKANVPSAVSHSDDKSCELLCGVNDNADGRENDCFAQGAATIMGGI